MKIDLVIIDNNNPLKKYLFKGIKKYMNWIHNIFIVTTNKEIMADLTSIKASVIDPVEFIPQPYIEFKDNLNTIDLFIYKIPNLSENFIVVYPDLFIVGELTPNDFFDPLEEQPLIDLISSENKITKHPWSKTIPYIYSNFVQDSPSGFRLQPEYTLIPNKKAIWESFWKTFGDEIIQTFSKQASELNYNAIACIYFGLTNKLIQGVKKAAVGDFNYDTSWAGIIKYDLLTNQARKIVYIKSLEKVILHKDASRWINEAFSQRII